MKFLYAVVMLALALGAQASVIPWAAHAWDDGSWHGDAWGHDGAWHGDDGSWHGDVWGAHGPAIITPGIGLAQGPSWGHIGAAVVHAPAVAVHHGHGHEGHYVAKTRGAVHTAPLAGHVASVSSVNVAPAPGTH